MATIETEAISAPPVKRLTLAEYDEMIREGKFDPKERDVLFDGIVVKKMVKGLRHVAITHRLFKMLARSLPLEWDVHKEDPVNLPSGPVEGAPSRPEPDVFITKGPEGSFDQKFPSPDDIVVAVEVASDARRLSEDRKALDRYAWNSIRCVWIVNLANNTIEVYTEPSGPLDPPCYRDIAVKKSGDLIRVTLDDAHHLDLDVSELLA